MERGTGRYWTEEEIKALLNVWSEKSIRKQLNGTLRNKGIFIYIAKRLQDLGVYRDWKQCRAKYKNLKYEYRTVKYAHNSGDSTKSMRFFHELDGILTPEHNTRLAQDGKGRCSAAEAQLHLDSNTGEISIALEDDDTVDDPLIFASNAEATELANEGGKHWTLDEVRALIRLWSDRNIQRQLEGSVRNKRIFEHIAAMLQELGIDRDWKQCRTKYKNLKHEYNTVKKAHDSGNTRKTMKFFNELDTILGHKAAGQSSRLDMDEREGSMAQTDLRTENNSPGTLQQPGCCSVPQPNGHVYAGMPGDGAEEESVSSVSEDPRAIEIKKESSDVDEPPADLDEDHYGSNILEDPGIVHIKKEAIDLDEESRSSVSEDLAIPALANIALRTSSGYARSAAEFFIPAISTEGGKHWTAKEVKALIHLWSDKNIQHQLEGSVRNKRIFEHIAVMLQELGIDRDWKQCRTKYKNLKHEYKTVKKAHDSGNTRKTMKFFSELDAIMGYKVAGQSSQSDIEEREGSLAQTDSRAENNSLDVPVEAEEKNFHSHGSENPGAVYIKKDAPDIDDDSSTTSEDLAYPPDAKGMVLSGINHFRIITVGDTGAGKHWSDHEVRALIHIWSDETIQKQLEGATRNKEIFEEIANRLMEFGIDRDWKQCRTKYKNLKYEYHALQKENSQLSNPRRFMKFYEDVDCILRRQPPTAPSQISKVPNSSFAPSSSSSSEETQQVDCTLHLGSHCTGSDISVSTADKMYTSGLKRKALDNESPVPVKIKNSGSTSDLHQRSMTDEVSTKTGQMDRGVMNCGREEHSQHFSKAQLSLHPPAPHHLQIELLDSKMENITELKVGKKLNEGKTKEVYELPELPGYVLMQSKDQITAGNAARKDHMEGKAAISNKTTSCVFKLLQEAGVKTAFVRKYSDTAFVAAQCEMIPIEWVCRRIATGSFLKRHPGVKEGYKFYPPKREMFFKDDANNDPQWSAEQILAAKFNCAGLLIGQTEVDIMSRSTVAIFEILEKAWSTQDCTLVDMKIEFGVDVSKKEIVLADVIDNDSWRLWPSGDRSQQKDKQTYRDLKEVTPEAMQMVKRNFEWVAARVELLLESAHQGRVVVLMGSISDLLHCEKIKKSCANYGIPCELRVTSAHKGPDETLRIKSEYEGDGVPTVFVAVAGRSNGLGPVLSGNTAYPVVNCPPLTADWGAQDVWSSLRMPSGLGCSTVLSPEAAAQFAAQIFGLSNHLVWSKLRSSTLNTWISLKQADKKLRECSI
ncbi:bifunctional phosphoribosylaminoimidazole carboxylase/phosphoribosylaminoimidazole succinocarboxamide synthetase isoform X2 [Microcaecilia unicolor]|uniref:Uncharacterized protein LOC115461542 isoform X2 n=1 Tax=Microcaecilia unicolor TaxID=1415580 RepID=A0A6P7WVR1_9AMPH|nr:uncharacterized protein LOC115461542 isoform X2 [Microcaecilia unicolor]